VAYFYLHFSKNAEAPWNVLETNANKTEIISGKGATEIEINVPCKTFANRYHYFACEGEVTWEGTKAIINAPTTFQHQPLV
jgi:hypothetical protein